MNERKWSGGNWMLSMPVHLLGQVYPGIKSSNDGVLVIPGTQHDTGGVFGPTQEIALANANLMISAPYLYEALENLVATFDPDKQAIYGFARDDIERARAALAKARGEA